MSINSTHKKRTNKKISFFFIKYPLLHNFFMFLIELWAKETKLKCGSLRIQDDFKGCLAKEFTLTQIPFFPFILLYQITLEKNMFHQHLGRVFSCFNTLFNPMCIVFCSKRPIDFPIPWNLAETFLINEFPPNLNENH